MKGNIIDLQRHRKCLDQPSILNVTKDIEPQILLTLGAPSHKKTAKVGTWSQPPRPENLNDMDDRDDIDNIDKVDNVDNNDDVGRHRQHAQHGQR